MTFKSMAVAGALVIFGSLLMPLYATYGVIGYIIAGAAVVLVALFTYSAASVLEAQRAAARASDVDAREAVQASDRQLAEQHERFISHMNRVQEQMLQVMKDMSSFQQGSLQQLEEAKNGMLSIAKDQQVQAEKTSEQLGDFTSRIVSLFDGRLKEEFESIRATRTMIGENLSELRSEAAQAEQRQTAYLNKLETTYSGVAELLTTSQKALANQLKQHMSDLKLAIVDTLDDSKGVMEDVLKSQKRNIQDVLEEIQLLQSSLLKELFSQGEHQRANLEILQKLQEEILDLNQQDMKLISKLMKEKV
ncbi:hypothetical protein D3C73_615110 [compost metagenome]